MLWLMNQRRCSLIIVSNLHFTFEFYSHPLPIENIVIAILPLIANNHYLLVQNQVNEECFQAVIDLATSDEAFMHTIILLAANHWVRVYQKPAAVAISLAHHKVEALRIINERLGSPEIASADGTIGAIAAISLLR
jgi:hypothetical protein